MIKTTVCTDVLATLSQLSIFSKQSAIKTYVVFCISVCVNEGQVCGDGSSPYPGITCCTGLQCDGSHCRKPGGKTR